MWSAFGCLDEPESYSVVQFLQRVCLSPVGWNSRQSGRRKRRWGSNCSMNRIFSLLKYLFCQVLSLAQILQNNKRTLHCHFSLKAHRFQISLFPVASLLSIFWNFINTCSPLYALTRSLCLLVLNLLKLFTVSFEALGRKYGQPCVFSPPWHLIYYCYY